ncbi:hypothetical protein [Nocardiopsis kunsanensis]|uniref:hypothetical protein n=1 Tax=Nocardiopsis kunsanensis TaxID=141693 RepID=UPI001EF9FA1E|nr:hypothetical protein [Nocardiopsis kunsanensis]
MPQGGRVAYVSDSGSTSAVWILDLGTGETEPVVGEEDAAVYRTPTWHPDGDGIAYIVDGQRIETLDLSSNTKDTVHQAPEGGELWAVSYGPSGKLAHVLVEWPHTTLFVDGEPLTAPPDEPAALPPAWISAEEIVHGMDGDIHRLSVDGSSEAGTIPFSAVVYAAGAPPELGQPVVLPEEFDAQGIASPVLSPDGESVCFRALGAIWLLRWGGEPERIIGDGAFNTDPSWLPDGRSIVYSSDRTGVPNLWRHTLGEDTGEQLTDLETGAFTPSVSPDGAQVAFQDEEGATFVLVLDSGEVRELAEPTYRPGRPSWSPDCSRVTMAVTAPVSPRDDSGHNGCLVVDVSSGESTVHTVAEHRSIATRGDDGPVWSPDGEHMIAVIDSRVHRVPVDEAGKPTGEPVVLSELVADSVSVSAGGDVLFLSIGELVLLRGEEDDAERHPPGLRCTQREAAPARVIRAGALWDGSSDDYRRNVDITVRDGVIEEVTDAGTGTEPDLDASDRTVIPGLIDTHNHWHLHGREWAGRQGPLWLAYGVTTSRSPGDPAYQMVETREAIHSGAAIGPRFLGSGEGLDGRRCHFGFMRCVSSEAQLELEVQRILGLGYNVVKSYQHLPVYLEHELVDRMREEEVPVVSHYLYPALSTGLNGMEHTGGEATGSATPGP